MSFFNTKPWSKIPTDILENKAMRVAEQLLPESLTPHVVLLYLAGAIKSSEDGIFDIEDGAEFAQLIKVKSPATVTQIAQAMMQARILAYIPNSTVYIFKEWEYSGKSPKSLTERFKKALDYWQKKKSEENYFCSLVSTKVDNLQNGRAYTSDKGFNPSEGGFNPNERGSDPSEKGFNPGAPAPQIREEQIRADTEQTIPYAEQTTHTYRVEGAGEGMPPPSGPMCCPTGGGIEKEAELEQIMPDPGQNRFLQSLSVVQENGDCENPLPTEDEEEQDASSVPAESEKKQGEALDSVIHVLEDFFVQNNAAYNVRKGHRQVAGIAREILEVTEGDAGAADRLARNMCAEFKKMHDAPPADRWSNIPLLPLYMAKEAVWAQLSSRVSRIYGAAKRAPAHRDYESELAEGMRDREETAREMDAEYIRMGIDPGDPYRVAKLMAKKAGGGYGGQ